MVRPTLSSDLLNVSGTNVAKAGHVMGSVRGIAADWHAHGNNGLIFAKQDRKQRQRHHCAMLIRNFQ
jgi:hypothetical protein